MMPEEEVNLDENMFIRLHCRECLHTVYEAHIK